MFTIREELRRANIPRTIRFTETTYSRLLTTAEESNIPFNSLVLQCCCYALDSMVENDAHLDNPTSEV